MPVAAAIQALSHLVFPLLCKGCNKNECEKEEWICFECLLTLPYTGFEICRDNPVERLFWGRTPISFASSTFYYVEKTPIQKLIHEVKYKEQQALGNWLGELMGRKLITPFQQSQINLLLPMPLHPKRQRERGYNQATLLCKGISRITGLPYSEELLVRNTHTSSQTKKSRIERWDNVQEVFSISNPSAIRDQHIALIDDVITTGASTEACVSALLNNGAKTVSVCSLAFTL